MTDAKLTAAQESAAVKRIHESLALRSGAGCGKTYVLARRFTELLMASGGEVNPLSRFVALTFTDKAALEMTDRVRRMLAEFADAATTPEERRRLLGWLEEAGDARISTIHSFCSVLLRTHAIEAGVDPNFAVCADDLVARQMACEAADQAVLSAVEGQNTDVADLLTHLTFEQAVEHVSTLLHMRTGVDLEQYADAQAVLDRWQQLLADHRDRLWRDLQADTQLVGLASQLADVDCVGTKLESLQTQLLAAAGELLMDQAAWRSGALARAREVSPGGLGGKNYTACRHLMKDVQAGLEKYAMLGADLADVDRQAAGQLATLARLSQSAVGVYAKAKRAAGMLDFDDLLAATHGLLLGNERLRKRLAADIDQLLIDECQDTDRFQLELLGALVGDVAETTGQGTRDSGLGETPEPPKSGGRLFVVGDAKQSIYRFRGAQVEVFEDLCRKIGARHQEHLDISFRTHDAGVSFVNDVFEKLMGEDYAPTFAHRKDTPPHPSVEILLAGGEEEITIADDATAAQAAVVAQRIRQMLDRKEHLVWDDKAKAWRPVRQGDIAILFARMTNSLQYERELAVRDIDYYVVAGTGFFKQQEVYDLLNVLRAIDNPLDDIALVGVLRSGLFGLDDNDLMHISQACGRPYFDSLRTCGEIAALSADAMARLVSAVALVSRLHARKDSMGIDELLSAVLEATAYEATLLAQRQGKRMCGNVHLLIERARSASALAMALPDFVSQMDELVINESRYEQAAVAGEAEDVVRLMTIHKAKGLEFPVVIVPDLNASRRGVTAAILNRNDWGLTYKLKLDDEEDGESQLPLAYSIAKGLEDADGAREDVRKLYVAMTRHEDHLVLVGADWRAKEGGFRSKGSYLQQLDEVLGLSQMRSEAEQETAGLGTRDSGLAKTTAEQASPGTGLPLRKSMASEEIGLTSPQGHREADEDTTNTAGETPATQLRPYAGGKYNALVQCVKVQAVRRKAVEKPLGQRLLETSGDSATLASRLAEAMAGTDVNERLVGPIPPQIAQTELAVTALGDFARCPMLFHWRYELAVPSKYLMEYVEETTGAETSVQTKDAQTPGKNTPAEQSPGNALPGLSVPNAASSPTTSPTTANLDAATVGTIFHRCMELMDFANPRPLALVQTTLTEMGLDQDIDAAALAADLQAMIDRMAGAPLWDKLRTARQVLRELPLTLGVDGAILRGQIDMIFEDDQGRWHVVDYKSDRVNESTVVEHAKSYRLQMLLYALAAWRHTGTPPAQATLYFLRAGLTHSFDVSAESLEEARKEAHQLAGQLAQSRRTHRYTHCSDDHCTICFYRQLCGRSDG